MTLTASIFINVVLLQRCCSLTPHSTVLLEQLTGSQLVKKFPTFHRTRRFITAFTNARHLSLSWASSIQSIPPHIPLPKDPSYYYPPIYAWVSQVVSFFQVSPPKPCIQLSSPLYALHARPISFCSIFHPKNIAWEVQIIKLLIM